MRTRRHLPFAGFAVVSVVICAAMIMALANVSWNGRATYLATFDDVTGLDVGDDVRLAGVRVGRVDAVDVVGGRAEVALTVERDVELPADSIVEVRWVDLIGATELLLLPGESTATLEDGARIEATRAGTDLAVLADQLGPLTATLDPERLNELVASIVAALDGREHEVARLVRELDTVLATFTERGDLIGTILRDYRDLSATIARRDEQIVTLVDHLGVLTGTLDEADEIVVAAIEEAGQVARNADRFLAASADDLERVLADLVPVVGGLVADRERFDAALGGLPDAFGRWILATEIGDAIELEACVSPTSPPCSELHVTDRLPGVGQEDGS